MANTIIFKKVILCLILFMVVATVFPGCSGKRTIDLSNGASYTGEIKGSKPNGQGAWTHPDGYSYIGEFKDGMRHGQGVFTFPDGTVQSGRFEQDEYIGQ